jgi:hypothetical protein
MQAGGAGRSVVGVLFGREQLCGWTEYSTAPLAAADLRAARDASFHRRNPLE